MLLAHSQLQSLQAAQVAQVLQGRLNVIAAANKAGGDRRTEDHEGSALMQLSATMRSVLSRSRHVIRQRPKFCLDCWPSGAVWTGKW